MLTYLYTQTHICFSIKLPLLEVLGLSYWQYSVLSFCFTLRAETVIPQGCERHLETFYVKVLLLGDSGWGGRL